MSTGTVFTVDEIEARYARADAADAAAKAAWREVLAIDDAVHTLIMRHRDVFGHPKEGQRLGDVLFDRLHRVFDVAVEHYVGHGEWTNAYDDDDNEVRIAIPAEALAAPDALIAALTAEREARRVALLAAEQAEATEQAASIEAQERATYERLRAKFGEG